MKQIARLKEILGDEKVLLGVIRKEILEIGEKFRDERRTQISMDPDYDLTTEDLIPRENVVITMSSFGYIKRMTEDLFRSQNRGGKGIRGMQKLEGDYVSDILMTGTHNYLMFFTNMGRVYRLKGYEVPEAGRNSRGTAMVNLLQLQGGEKVTAVIPVENFDEDKFLLTVTRRGIVKRTPLSEYANVRKKGLTAINLREDDELIGVKFTDGSKDILMVTRQGHCIRFRETDVRVTGRASMGVIGMNISADDCVVAAMTADEGTYMLLVSEKGMGKRTDMREFSAQNRGGKGVMCYRITAKTGEVAGAMAVSEGDEILIVNTEGIIIRMKCADISIVGRITSGVKLMSVKEDEVISCITRAMESRDLDEEEE